MLLWLAAWAAVIVLAQLVPVAVAIGLATLVFAAQVLATPGRGTCHLPRSGPGERRENGPPA